MALRQSFTELKTKTLLGYLKDKMAMLKILYNSRELRITKCNTFNIHKVYIYRDTKQ